MLAQHRIGAELPQYQIGLGSDDRSVEALEHVADDLAADAPIEHRDRMAGKALAQFGPEPGRVICCLGTGAGAFGRRRADCDDGDRLGGSELAGKMREQIDNATLCDVFRVAYSGGMRRTVATAHPISLR
jgi:hypothetical protein